MEERAGAVRDCPKFEHINYNCQNCVACNDNFLLLVMKNIIGWSALSCAKRSRNNFKIVLKTNCDFLL